MTTETVELDYHLSGENTFTSARMKINLYKIYIKFERSGQEKANGVRMAADVPK